MKELETLKAEFLSADLDPETRDDNLKLITEWEQSLRENENFLSWVEHPVTKEITNKAKEVYKDITMRLALDRKLDDKSRNELWGRQDAASWLISLASKDARAELQRIEKEITTALHSL